MAYSRSTTDFNEADSREADKISQNSRVASKNFNRNSHSSSIDERYEQSSAYNSSRFNQDRKPYRNFSSRPYSANTQHNRSYSDRRMNDYDRTEEGNNHYEKEPNFDRRRGKCNNDFDENNRFSKQRTFENTSPKYYSNQYEQSNYEEQRSFRRNPNNFQQNFSSFDESTASNLNMQRKFRMNQARRYRTPNNGEREQMQKEHVEQVKRWGKKEPVKVHEEKELNNDSPVGKPIIRDAENDSGEESDNEDDCEVSTSRSGKTKDYSRNPSRMESKSARHQKFKYNANNENDSHGNKQNMENRNIGSVDRVRPDRLLFRRNNLNLNTNNKNFPEKQSADMFSVPKPNGKLPSSKMETIESQRECLIDQLRQCTYECMVCCANVKHDKAIWSCDKCYHIFHLYCIKKWARSASSVLDEASNGWRCPACQNVVFQVPSQYTCFCGKVTNPEYSVYDTPHSCGGVCGKKRPASCPHPCNILCHPGPCPPCQATVTRKCDCEKTQQTVRCGQIVNVKCQEVCNKSLNCASHSCQQKCHSGACAPCDIPILQECFCGKLSRSVICGTSEFFAESFCCNEICDRRLDCGNHRCLKKCHDNQCQPCQLLPSQISSCPCGKTLLSDLPNYQPRNSCKDPIPVCDKTCGKPIGCGPTDKPHLCTQKCHQGPCGPCDGEMQVTCQCRAVQKSLTCKEVMQLTEAFRCAKRCNKKKQCGRHKCSQNCCTDVEHKCDQVCGRKLSCGLHRCEELCHTGNCPTCYNVSFDELRCHCGTSVIYPPVPCGTHPPECYKPCTRTHSCNHEVNHPCHSDTNCPPCAVLTEKLCMGGHELRKNIPCYVTEVSCGKTCGKRFACGMHGCKQICHKGECVQAAQCDQPCTRARDSCAHPCLEPCHPGWPCPQTQCNFEVTIYCKCDRLSEKIPCWRAIEVSDDDERLMLSMRALRVSENLGSERVNISELVKSASRKTKILSCNEECARIERNKQLAEALDIQSPELSSKPSPQYSTFLKSFAKKNPKMITEVEKALGDLVQAVQQSKQQYRRHAFPRMNREQRQMVHELAEVHGCESESYDDEPNRNVVATAQKGKCSQPTLSLSAVVREGKQKTTVPIPPTSKLSEMRSGVSDNEKRTQLDADVSSSTRDANAWSYVRKAASAVETKKPKEPLIDYFDMTPIP